MHGLHYLAGQVEKCWYVTVCCPKKVCRNRGSVHHLVHWYLLKEHQIPWDAPPQVESNHKDTKKISYLTLRGDSGETGCNVVVGW